LNDPFFYHSFLRGLTKGKITYKLLNIMKREKTEKNMTHTCSLLLFIIVWLRDRRGNIIANLKLEHELHV